MNDNAQGQALLAPNQGKPWTPEDREQLKHLYLHGFNLKSLCDRLGRTPHGVLSQLSQMHLVYCDHRTGHYFPCPQEPWVMWQEVKTLHDAYKFPKDAKE